MQSCAEILQQQGPGAPEIDHLIQKLIHEDKVLAETVFGEDAAIVLQRGGCQSKGATAARRATRTARTLTTLPMRWSSSSTYDADRLSLLVAHRSRPPA